MIFPADLCSLKEWLNRIDVCGSIELHRVSLEGKTHAFVGIPPRPWQLNWQKYFVFFSSSNKASQGAFFHSALFNYHLANTSLRGASTEGERDGEREMERKVREWEKKTESKKREQGKCFCACVCTQYFCKSVKEKHTISERRRSWQQVTNMSSGEAVRGGGT